jgi:lysophospholipase L1-like esterase
MSSILSPSDFKRYSGYTCCLLGESITMYSNYRFGVKSVTHSNGTVTVVDDGGGHTLWPGAEFTLTLPAGVEPEFAGRRVVTERVSGTSFRFATSPDAPLVARDQNSIVAINHGQQTDQSWFHWFNSRLRGRFKLLNNGGVSGANTKQIAQLVDSEVIAYSPHFCFVLSGTNDASQSIPLTQTCSNLETIYTRLVNAGITVVALTIPPLGAAYSSFAQASHRIAAINQWIRDYADAHPGILLVDTWAALVDSTSTTGAAATDMLGSDGVHQTALGAKTMGDAIYDIMSDLIPPSRSAHAGVFDSYGLSAVTVTLDRVANLVTATATNHGFGAGDEILVTGATPSDLNGSFTILSRTANTFTYQAPGANGAGSGTILAGTNKNLFDYGLFHTATGGTVTAPASGTAATGVSVSRGGGATVVASVVSAPTEWHPGGVSAGNAQRIVVTSSADGDTATIRSQAAQLSSRLLAGHRYYAECHVKLTNVSGANLSGLNFDLVFVIDSVTYIWRAFDANTSVFPTSDVTLFLRTAPIKVPSGTMTDQYWRVLPEFSASGTAITIDVGRVRVVQVD